MKKTTLTTMLSLAVACVGMGMAPATSAAYTNYLEGLQAEIAARLETNDVAAEKRALNSASKALSRNSKTLSQDLTAFGQAINTLNRAFPDDGALVSAEEGAFNQFLTEAESQLNAVKEGATLHTTVPVSLSNAIAKADSAYTNAVGNTNWAARVRALNLALVKIKVAQIQLAKSLKAPANVDGKTINVVLKADGTQRFALNSDGTYDTGNGETGTWSYARTGANTATITLNAEGGGTHVMNATFKNTKAGTFTLEGEDGTGTFTVK
jgi:hypothetical protein